MCRCLLIALLAGLSSEGLGEADEPGSPGTAARIPDVGASGFQQFIAAIGRPSEARALLLSLPNSFSAPQLTNLRNLDRKLAVSDNAEDRRLAQAILRVLGLSGELRSLGYLHEVFESAPNRREYVAAAIAQFALQGRRRPQDWRLLVRSLPIVESKVALDVVRALRKFPQRGTKPQWQREVILVGLRTGDAGGVAAPKLLEYWATSRPAANASELSAWQAWFEEKYPNLPPPALPVDDASGHNYRELLVFLETEGREGEPAAGAKIYERTQCTNCHRIADKGEDMGPDLTTLGARRTDKEILQSLLFPSHTIDEEYQARTVITSDGRTLAGLIQVRGERLFILPADGKRVSVARENVEAIAPSRVSAMPGGLLDELSQAEIADLLAYLRDSHRVK